MLCFKHFGYATYCLPDTNINKKTIAESVKESPTADMSNVIEVFTESEQSNDCEASDKTEGSCDFNASNLTSSFDRLKVIYKKVGDNESQAFGVWQQLSESERTAAFAHTQRMQGDPSSRSYLYVYLRDREWTKVTSPT